MGSRKKDLTQFCRETHDTHQSVSESEFRQVWCKRCRNQECGFSQWGDGLWINRMETQVDRLLDNPNIGDPRQEQFRFLQDILFEDMKHQAVAIHIGNMNEDWSVPTQDQVSDFINKGNHLGENVPNPPKNMSSITDEKAEEIEESDPLIEIQDTLNQEESIQVQQPFELSKPNLPPSMNTPIEDMGIMIGGDQGLVSPQVSNTPSAPQFDDWSVPPPVSNLVPVGGRVVMGGGNPQGDTKK